MAKLHTGMGHWLTVDFFPLLLLCYDISGQAEHVQRQDLQLFSCFLLCELELTF